MLHPKPSGDIGKLEWIRQYLIIFLPFLTVLVAGGIAHYYTAMQTGRVTLESGEHLNVGLARSALNSEIANVVTDLKFIAAHLEQQNTDFSDNSNIEQLHELFATFAGEKRLYDQVRLIDRDGQEVIRINYRSGKPSPVPAIALQNKAGRYYFRETMQLAHGEVYISPLDLNMEQGVIEVPQKPMMRFAVPVFDRENRRLGILVLNYLGDRMLGNFARASANIADHIHLVNAEGYWLRSPKNSDSWGFMLPHGKRFSERYPIAWSKISAGISSQFRTSEGLFTFETVTPGLVASRTLDHAKVEEHHLQRWKVVAMIPPGKDSLTLWGYLQTHLPLYLIILFVLVVGSILLTNANIGHQRAELLTEYERRFRHALEDLQLAAVTIDCHARLIFCNDYFLDLTGWNREEVIGNDWVDRFISHDRQVEVRVALAGLSRDADYPRRIEAEILTRKGERRLIAWHNTLSQGVNGEISGITAVGEYITIRRQVEDKVRRLSRAVEQSPSIVMLTDRHGNIDYVNPKFTEVTGYKPAEVMGKNPKVLKSGKTKSDDYRQLWSTVMEGGVWRGEFLNRRKNGENYWESASISALRNPNGDITDFVAVKEDITERKRLEQEVEARNRELVSTQALAQMGRMASMIAHDLRNPLSSVKMGVQILGRQASGENAELAQIGLDQIRYMENILTDMLTYARPEGVKTEWVSIDKLIDITLVSIQKRIDESRAEIVVLHQPGLPTLPADANKLRQLFSNLMVNALQSLENQPEGERHLFISTMLHLGETGTSILIDICDDGSGLSEAEAERLFEPFYTTRTKGTGLGLAIVSQIAAQHCGSVSLKPRDGGGACASVILPTVPAGNAPNGDTPPTNA